MSTIAVDEARPSLGGTTYPLNEGIAKQRHSYNQTGTPAVNDSLNTSSITDNATGNHTPNFTNNFADGFYSVASTSMQNSGPHPGIVSFDYNASPGTIVTSSAYTVEIETHTSSPNDMGVNTAVAMGALA